ncbi:MAG: formyltetrahydrofolate deformylase [Spirochaetia bacterium]|jgi:formyltetrahydrofolate deformylase|nr:formyltetrahydrofolate deformylase [Spirochaetia bacterium]
MKTHILLIDCRDEAGIVYKVTGVLYKHECNIISNDEFVDKTTNHFFMRTEFSGDINKDEMLAGLRAALSSASISLVERKKKNIVIMATKEHHCVGDLILRHHYGELDADIRAVISNHAVLKDLAENFSIPFRFISHEGLERGEHEKKIIEEISNHSPDYIILAKYMRILSGDFVRHFPNRIINIHHSFLPAFIGANPYQQAHDRGVKVIGATAHFVTENLDEGPIIAQDVIPVNHRLEVKDMVQAGKDVEKKTLSGALKLALEDRIFVINNRTVIFN